ncbi:hypothetical protein QFZ34_001427 [Phyllobacterium ifriqiyense]|uniref:Uncharacterized protein n=1 Tax=Phyllobacterium ifriqiyense TaxID=314238 RepID=A0ABU0S8I4_9HYPH|nr:hypothetical protein [Phyllobacterium ifriqiyense]
MRCGLLQASSPDRAAELRNKRREAFRSTAVCDHGFDSCLAERHGKCGSYVAGSDDSNGHDPVLPSQLAVVLAAAGPSAPSLA